MTKKIKTATETTVVAAPAPADQTAILEQLDMTLAAPPAELGTAEPKAKKARKAKAVAAPAGPGIVQASVSDVLTALYPEGSKPAVQPQTLGWAVALLSRPVTISSLPAGSHFSLDGRFGTLVEISGQDAKVEWDGKTQYWSATAEVRWANELPVATPKASKVHSNGHARVIVETVKTDSADVTVAALAPKTRAPKAPKKEGPSNRDIVYLAWAANPALTVKELLALVNGDLDESTVKSYVGGWKRGFRLPACAAQTPPPVLPVAETTASPAEAAPASKAPHKSKKVVKV